MSRRLNGVPSGLGFDLSDIGNWFYDVGSQTANELANQLPKELADQIKNQLLPGQTYNPQTGTIQIATQAPPTYVQAAASSMGVPPAVIYGALGLMGVGVLLVLVKALK